MDYKLFLLGLVSFAVSALVQSLVIDIAFRKGLFIDDHNSDLPQKMHTQPTPRIGGLGIFLGLILFTGIQDAIGWKIMVSIIPAFLAGFLEDLYSGITPVKRLLIMSASSFISIYVLDAYVLDYGILQVPVMLGVLITVVAILGMVNGTNLLDGFNGMSSGISMIIILNFMFTSYRVHDEAMLTVTSVTFFAILGFYIFNFPKGRIFLGDAGAYSIGFLLAIFAILMVKRNPEQIDPFFALLSLIYPVWEVIFSFGRRIIAGKSPLLPDSLHFHQLIFRSMAGENNPKSSLLVYPIVVFFCTVSSLYPNKGGILAIASIAFIIVYTSSYIYLRIKSEKLVRANS
jgi:UDP-N-acetylmuramyl pentapeptide phosphotransferase/UDP-N-acetylglucosamine-1-phosphate transferase